MLRPTGIFSKKYKNCHPLCQFEPTESTFVSTDWSKTMLSLTRGIILQREFLKSVEFKRNKTQAQTGVNLNHLNQVKVFPDATPAAW